MNARINGSLEMYDSLHTAVNEAGGSGTSFKYENLKSMSVAELIERLGSNDVRFVYNKSSSLQQKFCDALDKQEELLCERS